MLPVTSSYWFRESYLSKFCFIIICEERKQKVLILNSSEKLFYCFLANIRHVRFNMVNSKHRYCRCLLIKICRPYHIVFTLRKSVRWKVARNETYAWLGTRTFHFLLNLKLALANRLLNKPSEKWSSECTTFEWEANWWKISNFYVL